MDSEGIVVTAEPVIGDQANTTLQRRLKSWKDKMNSSSDRMNTCQRVGSCYKVVITKLRETSKGCGGEDDLSSKVTRLLEAFEAEKHKAQWRSSLWSISWAGRAFSTKDDEIARLHEGTAHIASDSFWCLHGAEDDPGTSVSVLPNDLRTITSMLHRVVDGPGTIGPCSCRQTKARESIPQVDHFTDENEEIRLSDCMVA